MLTKLKAFLSVVSWTSKSMTYNTIICNIVLHVLMCSSAIRGRIDQVNQVLLLDKQTVNAARYNALDKWTNQLSSLHVSVINKMS